MTAQLDGVAPPGWERTVKKMKKHDDISNPFALAWWMRRRGAKPSKRDETEAAVDPDFEAELADAMAMAAAGRIPDVFYAAGRGETTACSLLLSSSGKLYVEQRRR